MKLFITKTLTFSFLLLVLISLRFFVLPYYYGNTIYASKVEYFKKNKAAFNTVIFGSSRLYRQLNPAIIDSINKDYNIKTFNLASPATFYPESTYLYEQFIEDSDTNELEYAIIELQHIGLYKNNAKTIRGNYWNTTFNLFRSLRFIGDSHYNRKKKSDLNKTICLSYLYRFKDFSSIKNIFKTEQSYTNRNYYNYNGFYSLEQELADSTIYSNEILKYSKNFKRDISNYNKLVETAKKQDTISVTSLALNHSYLQHILEIIKISKEKGIHVIYVLPPLLRLDHYKELFPVACLIPERNFINLSSYKNNRALYDRNVSFDYSHLNNKGTKALSITAGQSVLERLTKNK